MRGARRARRAAARGSLALLAAAGASACAVVGGPGAPATPQRPTFSSDTSLTAEGTLEVEAGVAVDPRDGGEVPVVLKLGAGPRTEVFLGGAPVRWIEGDDDEAGIGDLSVGVRHRVRDGQGERWSLALTGAVKLPLADEDRGLGTGEVDALFAFAAARAVGSLAVVAYGQLDVLGQPEDDTALGADLALAVGKALDRRLGAFGELTAIGVPEEDFEELLATAGLTYALDDATIFDVALQLGFGEDGRDPTLLVGVTRNFGPVHPRSATR